MKLEEYREAAQELRDTYFSDLHELKMQYVKDNCKFEVGDFVGNVTGIIKVERISYTDDMKDIEITYFGKRYKKVHGKLLRTKYSNISKMIEKHIQKITGDEQ